MIAITGASGLLGNSIAQRFSDAGIPFYGIKRSTTRLQENQIPMDWKESDILDTISLPHVFKGTDVVIHAAALVSFNPADAEILYRINVEGTRHVVNACLQAGVPRLLHISSVAALGRQKGTTTINENHKWVESGLNSDYAESKYLAELEVFRGQEEGLQIDIINPSVILAQSDWNRSSSQVFKYIWKQRPFFTKGMINYVDVRDVAEMVFRILHRKSVGDRIIANGGSVDIKDFLSAIANKFNKKAPWIEVPGALAGVAAKLEYIRSKLTGSAPIISAETVRAAQEKFFYDNKKAIHTLGMQFHTLEETLQWCCDYYLRRVQ